MKELTSHSYKSGRENLSDELVKIDSLLELHVSKFRKKNHYRKEDGFSGLYIDDEEVTRVLGKELEDANAPDFKRLAEKTQTIRKKISTRIEKSSKQGVYIPFFRLSKVFQLSNFEMDIILLCLAVELDLKYEKLFAYLNDDVTKKFPTINLILEMFCATPEEKLEARACFFEHAPLFKFKMVKFVEDNRTQPLLSKCIKCDDRMVSFFLEQGEMDAELTAITKIIIPRRDWQEVLTPEDDRRKQQMSVLLEEFFNDDEESGIVFYLKGPYGVGKKSTAEALCYPLNLPIIIIDASKFYEIESAAKFEEIVKKLIREAMLQTAVIYIEHFDALVTGNDRKNQSRDILIAAIEEFAFITFLAGEKPWRPSVQFRKNRLIKYEFPIPGFKLRKQLWKIMLNGSTSVSFGLDVDEIANKFKFTGGQIRDAFAEARNSAIMRGTFKKEGIRSEDLYLACHHQSDSNLSEMARKIVPRYIWPDIVLPEDKMTQLKEMCNYVKYRHIVYGDWGFSNKISLGKGLNILFSGASGTGKTMAAEIVAHELNLDLYKIDLSCIVSKYIGETEKNISAIFKEAETANAVLFFDEADALFGKRSEVKDSHDRYANIEINYLLQKMEEHEGIVILATNFRRNIDDAFTRRMHFALDFPFPDRKYRLDIWHKIFPMETPKSDNIDYEFLAKRFKISGGNIKNIALHSAFLAADNSRKIDMKHIILAARREYQKMGKLCTRAEFGDYYYYIGPGKGES